MIAVSGGALTRIEVIPEMPNNEDMSARGAGSQPGRLARCQPPVILPWPGRCTLALACVLSLQSAWADQPSLPAVKWKTGPQLEQQMDAIVGIHWAGNPLRNALASLSRSQGVAIFLDRRVDPDEPIEVSVQDTPVRRLLQDLAAHVEQGTCRVGPVVYVGPKRTVSVLATLAALRGDESRWLPSAAQSRLWRPKPMAWPELTRPRELVDRLATEVGLTVDGIEQVPHDLWPEIDLPPMTFIERMQLVLAGFHMTFECSPDGSTIRLVPMPETAALERTYPLRGRRADVTAVLSSRFPNARITSEAGKITVIGTVEDHEAIKRLIDGRTERPKPANSPAEGETVYTLKIEGPVGKIASGLAAKLGLQIEVDQRATPKLSELITLDVKEVSMEELLEALLSPAGLSYELTGDRLRVIPRGSPAN